MLMWVPHLCQGLLTALCCTAHTSLDFSFSVFQFVLYHSTSTIGHVQTVQTVQILVHYLHGFKIQVKVEYSHRSSADCYTLFEA